MTRSKPKIILVAGGTGAGKTTYASALSDKIGALRFSIDEWMTGLFWQALAQGLPIILDLGFTKKAHRKVFADWSAELGYPCELHWIKLAPQIRWERVETRNREKGETFAMTVTREMFDFMEGEWEDPSAAGIDTAQLVIISE